MTVPALPNKGADRARAAFESYRQTTAVAGTPMEALLRALVLDLGRFAAAEGIPFMPVIAHAQAWWLRESAKAKERAKVSSLAPAALR